MFLRHSGITVLVGALLQEDTQPATFISWMERPHTLYSQETQEATRLDRTSIIPLTVEDQNSEPIRKMKEEFESILKSKLKDKIESFSAGKDPTELEKLEKEMEAAWRKVETPEFVEYEAWEPSELGFDVPKEEKDEPLPEIKEADDVPDYDRYIATKVTHGGTSLREWVIHLPFFPLL